MAILTKENYMTKPRKRPEVTVEVELPAIPNFIRVGKLTLPVSQIKRSVLRKIGAAWVAELVRKGRRENR